MVVLQDSDDIAAAAIGAGGATGDAAVTATPGPARTPAESEDFLAGMQAGMELSYTEFVQALAVCALCMGAAAAAT